MSDKGSELLEIHAIQQLKYRYMRAVDTHDSALMASCFAEDANVWYENGLYTCKGRENILVFFRNRGDTVSFSSHIAMHPEIQLTGPATAKGIWRFQDIVHFSRATPSARELNIVGGEKAEGAGYYHDEYVKIGGHWLIQSTGYIRIFTSVIRPDYTGGKLTTDTARGMRVAAAQSRS